MFIFSSAHTESSVGYDLDIWKSSHESSSSCCKAEYQNTGLYVPYDSTTYNIARSLSECYEGRCTSLSDDVCLLSNDVQANINSTSVCLSNTSSSKQSQMQKLPVTLMSSAQSSPTLNALTLRSSCEPPTHHIVSDTSTSEMHTALPSSTVTVCCHSVDAV